MRIYLITSVVLITLSSCSKQLLISTGSRSNEPLIFDNEYKLENLKEIEVEGHAFFGIPSFKKNNKNNHSKGFIYTFNGIEIAKTPRIFPIITFLACTYYIHFAINARVATSQKFGEFYYNNKFISKIITLGITLPFSGSINNVLWKNACLSGASSTLYYRLINENPTVDVFCYPKYNCNRQDIFSPGKIQLKYLWIQNASIKANVTGATLKKLKGTI